jgi:photosystem II stability/assembly factor-like uncharacterized protein
MKKVLQISALLIIISVLMALGIQKVMKDKKQEREEMPKTSGAGHSMDVWAFERAYPFDKISTEKYLAAHRENTLQRQNRTRSLDEEWESMGPINVGGRTLCLAFHPTDPDVIFTGSAGGGLWMTTSQGEGQNAWSPVETGFPVTGVAAIAINPTDADEIYIGTGETYRIGTAEPGTVDRLTRGTYGIGILKSIDGGSTWTHVLEFQDEEIKGVQDIAVSPMNPNEVYAATSDGLYQSIDSGENWTLILAEQMCIDVEIDPNDDNVVYVTQGNFNNALDEDECGIFKTTDKGVSFSELLDDGLIAAWSGNAKLTIDPITSTTLYATIQVGYFNQDPTTPAGIYKSTDAGDNWEKINDQNIAQYQGWYSHDLAVNPNDTDEMIQTGIDTWKSVNTGDSFVKKSFWSNWPFGEISVDFPEGPDNYVHADIHAVYYHPLVSDKVFLATDGGVFSSDDGGEDFTTRNGGLQTMQFYANMASSTTDPDVMISGAQDNATYIYNGSSSWSRVIGGDGMCAGINPDNDNVIFGSYQRLGMRKSNNGGDSFSNTAPNLLGDDAAAFNGPFEIAKTDGDVMYAGAKYLYRSNNGANSWSATSGEQVDNGNVIISIEVSATDEDLLYVTTSPPDPLNGIEGAKVLKSTDGGANFTIMNGLPDRVCKDVAIDPENNDVAYAVFSGFGTGHLYKTENGGVNWFLSDLGLPDVPTNTVIVDDQWSSEYIYVGNDLSVYFSDDSGENWSLFDNQLPEAVMVMDLNISPSNNKLRIATHGRGIYQTGLVQLPFSIEEISSNIQEIKLYPNPVIDYVNLEFEVASELKETEIKLLNITGQVVKNVYSGSLNVGKNTFLIEDLNNLSSGKYIISISSENGILTKNLVVN